MPRQTITADRYMYLGIIGLAIILVWFLDHVYNNFKKIKKLLPIVVSAYFLGLGVHTFIRTKEWKNSDLIKNNVKEIIDKRKIAGKPLLDNPIVNE
jgi:hypothetical protein